ncbi:GNAT family N-acetyltransferase [Thalassomonas haliotis]|uniref:GNAT family N-acetyltransferase n=1 Tax=Thalassomonas haliotis TaxID=485448 RepID=A0ABY7V8W8_9GAMM|nr:GNAT family protein [Thalassomonas haliotis]WDE10001.1 GNAT family N-acetyltransferase [Thalassomonas haliotis]
MQLSSDRIKLTPFDPSDFDLFVELSMCPKMMEFVYTPFTREQATAAFAAKAQPWTIASENWLSLGINDAASGEKLGSIGIKITDHKARIAETGFMIKPSAQGKGFAGDALSLVKDYVFHQLKLNKLTATCAAGNTGSYKLLEKSGFLREGCLRQNTLINNRYVDDYVYGLCRGDL